MPAAPSSDFLTRKAGPLPVWAWAALGLGVAYLYAKYKAGKSATTSANTAATSSSSEPTSAVPQFLIQNYEPSSPSTPVNITIPSPVPVVTPPGTTTTPPVNTQQPPPPAGGTPPPNPGGPTPSAPPTAPAPTHVYEVQHGDTLSSIARRSGISLAQLLQMNPVYTSNPKYKGGNLIWAGDKVTLPGA